MTQPVVPVQVHMHTQMIDRSHKQQEADIRREAQLKGEIGAAEQEIDAAKAHLKVATNRKRDRDAEEVQAHRCSLWPSAMLSARAPGRACHLLC